MNKLSILILSGTFAATAFAQNAVTIPQAQMPGSPEAQAVAEAIHLKKLHGTDARAKQPEAQTPGSEKSQAVAEARHLRKSHGKINDAADKQLEFGHPNH